MDCMYGYEVGLRRGSHDGGGEDQSSRGRAGGTDMRSGRVVRTAWNARKGASCGDQHPNRAMQPHPVAGLAGEPARRCGGGLVWGPQMDGWMRQYAFLPSVSTDEPALNSVHAKRSTF
jgi:hypothetical protein